MEISLHFKLRATVVHRRRTIRPPAAPSHRRVVIVYRLGTVGLQSFIRPPRRPRLAPWSIRHTSFN